MKPQPYIPKSLTSLSSLPDVPSAWRGIDLVLTDLLTRLEVPRDGLFLEVGTDYGYSAAALSHFCKELVTVDSFADIHAGGRSQSEVRAEAERNLAPYPNVNIVTVDYREFCSWWDKWMSSRRVSLVHCDADHSYEATKELGQWAVGISPVVLFHDTQSHEGVARACEELTEEHNLYFYERPEHYGLGILSRREMLP